jgi:hypothetical protein
MASQSRIRTRLRRRIAAMLAAANPNSKKAIPGMMALN